LLNQWVCVDVIGRSALVYTENPWVTLCMHIELRMNELLGAYERAFASE